MTASGYIPRFLRVPSQEPHLLLRYGETLIPATEYTVAGESKADLLVIIDRLLKFGRKLYNSKEVIITYRGDAHTISGAVCERHARHHWLIVSIAVIMEDGTTGHIEYEASDSKWRSKFVPHPVDPIAESELATRPGTYIVDVER